MVALYPIVRLECDGLDTLLIDPSTGVIPQVLDLGDAITRVVAQDAVDADGTNDSTEFIGARNVTLSVTVLPESGVSTWLLRRRLRAFTHPRLRPVMFVQQAADAPEQRIMLRRSQFTDLLRGAGNQAQDLSPIVAQWVAPLGILESAVEHVVSIFAAGGATAGRAYSLVYPRVYPASAALGTGSVVNDGTADQYPLIRIYGPTTEPVLTNQTQGKALAFVGLTLAAGEFLEISTRQKTILLNGDSSASRYSKLSFPASNWFTLSPGENTLRFHPATYTATVTLAEITWRDADL